MFGVLTILVAVFISAAVVWAVVSLFRRRQHPLAITLIGLNCALMLGVLGVASVVPAHLWFLWWIAVVAVVIAMVFASVRATSPAGQHRQTKSPSNANLIITGVMTAGILAALVLAG